MKKISNHFGILIFLVFSAGLGACISSRTNEELIVGEWEAEWQTSPDKDLASSSSMKGKVYFSEDGQVEMIGYGRPGCVFSSDTLKNKLKWRLAESQLELSNMQEAFRMQYEIKDFSENKVQLVLMNDIRLVLSR